MLYSVPQSIAITDMLIGVSCVNQQCVITLLHDETIIDRFHYAKSKSGAVKVPGNYLQSDIGAANHATDYWFIKPKRKQSTS